MKLTPFIYAVMIFALSFTGAAFADGDDADDNGDSGTDTAIQAPYKDFSEAYIQEINKTRSVENPVIDEESHERSFESKTSRL